MQICSCTVHVAQTTSMYYSLTSRLNEQSNNVNDNRRLFDSQNNNAAGYQVGDACIPNCLSPGTNTYNNSATGAGEGVMQFYEDSKLYIEWTNQHGSQSPHLHNNVVLQYMCDDGDGPIRDGKIKEKFEEETEPTEEYGVHESYKYWDECRLRERNGGLFKADQNLKTEARQFTRDRITTTAIIGMALSAQKSEIITRTGTILRGEISGSAQTHQA
jgi:hypothetical protein